MCQVRLTQNQSTDGTLIGAGVNRPHLVICSTYDRPERLAMGKDPVTAIEYEVLE